MTETELDQGYHEVVSPSRERAEVRPHPVLGHGRSAGRVPLRAVATIALITALGLVPSLAWKLTERDPAPRGRQAAPNPRYPSQSASLNGTQKVAVATRAAQEVQAATDVCRGVGLQALAAKYGVAPEPESVARRFARGYDPGLQPGIRRGCLAALRAGG
jgi:hypothetical protein